MFIKEITWEHRNDFYAILRCEHCGHEQELKTGYHDGFYHQNVLPAINCKVCGKDRHGNYIKPATSPVQVGGGE